MGRWGAWDFETPMMREVSSGPGERVLEVFVPEGWGEVTVESAAGPEPTVTRSGGSVLDPYVIRVASDEGTSATAAVFTVRAGAMRSCRNPMRCACSW